MRILYLADWGIHSGIGKVTRYMVAGLRKRGFEVAVVSPYMAVSPFVQDGVKIYPGMVLDERSVDRILGDFEPDVLVIHMPCHSGPWSAISKIFASKGVRILWYLPLEFSRVNFKYVEKLLWTNLIAVPSRFALGVLGAHIPSDHLIWVPHGVDFEVFKPSGERRRDASGRLFVYLTVAANTFRKDFPTLMRAFSIADREVRSNSVLKLCTSLAPTGVARAYWDIVGLQMSLDADLPVEILDVDPIWGMSEEELAELYRSSDCYVQISMGEGFCLPVLEAMACGLPVIASENTALVELVEGAGILVKSIASFTTSEGWELRRTDVMELTVAMEAVFRDAELRRKLGERGVEKAREYSWDRACDKMAEAIERCMWSERLRPKLMKAELLSSKGN